MPSRRVGRPVMVVASLIAFSVFTLVFIGEGFKLFVRKDGIDLGRRDFSSGLHLRRELMTLFRAASNSISDRDVASEHVDCHGHVSVIPALPLVDGTQYQEDVVDAGSTTVSTFLAQGTNTVSLALAGRSDMVSVILANINSLVSHPTTSGNSARDATGMLAIAMANAKPSAPRTAALSVTTSSLESLAAFELFKKSAMQEDHVHSGDCDCASCVASPVALSPLTAAPHFPTLHPLMPRAYMATVTVTVTSCSDSSGKGPSSNSTAPADNNPESEPVSSPKSTSPGGNNPASSPESSNSTASGGENPAPAPESASSNPTKPGSPNSSPSNVAPFANNTASAQSATGEPAGSASSSSAIANAASYLMGNASQATGNAQSSNNAANPPSSATSTKSSPAENTAPASSSTIQPPITSQASSASSGLDNNVLSLITHVKLTLANIGYLIVTVGPVACLVIMGQVWLL
ncbi:hypothetical protein CJF30_00006809 [Rutstroemia sp. NJR-2017a BBW]|nr:hypothetical protein CJF30_00006809 [Rutstroemia sp. NJR-2017a BBW]